MFAYYRSVGVNNAGYPAHDTLNCPALKTSANTANSCQWQGFTNKYVLFVYASPLAEGAQNFATRDPFFTVWTNFGGIDGLGPASSAEAQITTKYTTTATVNVRPGRDLQHHLRAARRKDLRGQGTGLQFVRREWGAQRNAGYADFRGAGAGQWHDPPIVRSRSDRL